MPSAEPARTSVFSVTICGRRASHDDDPAWQSVAADPGSAGLGRRITALLTASEQGDDQILPTPGDASLGGLYDGVGNVQREIGNRTITGLH